MPAENNQLDRQTLLKASSWTLAYFLDPKRGNKQHFPTEDELKLAFPNQDISIKEIENFLRSQLDVESTNDIYSEETTKRFEEELAKERREMVAAEQRLQNAKVPHISLAQDTSQTRKRRVSALGILAELDDLEEYLRKHRQNITPQDEQFINNVSEVQKEVKARQRDFEAEIKDTIETIVDDLKIKIPEDNKDETLSRLANETTEDIFEKVTDVADTSHFQEVIASSIIDSLSVYEPDLPKRLAEKNKQKLKEEIFPAAKNLEGHYSDTLETAATLSKFSALSKLTEITPQLQSSLSTITQNTLQVTHPLATKLEVATLNLGIGNYLKSYLQTFEGQVSPVLKDGLNKKAQQTKFQRKFEQVLAPRIREVLEKSQVKTREGTTSTTQRITRNLTSLVIANASQLQTVEQLQATLPRYITNSFSVNSRLASLTGSKQLKSEFTTLAKTILQENRQDLIGVLESSRVKYPFSFTSLTKVQQAAHQSGLNAFREFASKSTSLDVSEPQAEFITSQIAQTLKTKPFSQNDLENVGAGFSKPRRLAFLTSQGVSGLGTGFAINNFQNAKTQAFYSLLAYDKARLDTKITELQSKADNLKSQKSLSFKSRKELQQTQKRLGLFFRAKNFSLKNDQLFNKYLAWFNSMPPNRRLLYSHFLTWQVTNTFMERGGFYVPNYVSATNPDVFIANRFFSGLAFNLGRFRTGNINVSFPTTGGTPQGFLTKTLGTIGTTILAATYSANLIKKYVVPALVGLYLYFLSISQAAAAAFIFGAAIGGTAGAAIGGTIGFFICGPPCAVAGAAIGGTVGAFLGGTTAAGITIFFGNVNPITAITTAIGSSTSGVIGTLFFGPAGGIVGSFIGGVAGYFIGEFVIPSAKSIFSYATSGSWLSGLGSFIGDFLAGASSAAWGFFVSGVNGVVSGLGALSSFLLSGTPIASISLGLATVTIFGSIGLFAVIAVLITVITIPDSGESRGVISKTSFPAQVANGGEYDYLISYKDSCTQTIQIKDTLPQNVDIVSAEQPVIKNDNAVEDIRLLSPTFEELKAGFKGEIVWEITLKDDYINNCEVTNTQSTPSQTSTDCQSASDGNPNNGIETSRDELVCYIAQVAQGKKEKLSQEDLATIMIKILDGESGGNQCAVSTVAALGIYQFTAGTWAGYMQGDKSIDSGSGTRSEWQAGKTTCWGLRGSEPIPDNGGDPSFFWYNYFDASSDGEAWNPFKQIEIAAKIMETEGPCRWSPYNLNIHPELCNGFQPK